MCRCIAIRCAKQRRDPIPASLIRPKGGRICAAIWLVFPPPLTSVVVRELCLQGHGRCDRSPSGPDFQGLGARQFQLRLVQLCYAGMDERGKCRAARRGGGSPDGSCPTVPSPSGTASSRPVSEATSSREVLACDAGPSHAGAEDLLARRPIDGKFKPGGKELHALPPEL